MSDVKAKKIGIIAGGGKIPAQFAKLCIDKGYDVHIIAIDGHAEKEDLRAFSHDVVRLGAVGRAISILIKNQIKDVVIIGSVRRPSFIELRPDLTALKILIKSSFTRQFLGDNKLLSLVKETLHEKNIFVHAVQDLAPEFLMPQGFITNTIALPPDYDSIATGVKIVETLGLLDVGQAAVIQGGIVLGVEAIEGTASLLERCAHYKRNDRGAILVKLCKPQQDKALDLPTIGPDTIKQAAAAGMVGIAVHANNSLIINIDELIRYADAAGIFVVGINPREF
jgi:DUF1009 family protein